jgi:hypothetical protein
MKSFVLAVAALIVISVGASVVLNSGFQKSVDQSFATSGARVERAK